MKNKKPIDEKTGFDINDDFFRFDQRNEIYCRSEWDPEIKSKNATEFFSGHYMPNARARKADGFGQKDYALRNATWHVWGANSCSSHKFKGFPSLVMRDVFVTMIQ